MAQITLEHFPDEILLEILKYIRFNVLFNTFLNLNSRFNAILHDVHPPIKVANNTERQAALYFARSAHHLLINQSIENDLRLLSLNICQQIRSLSVSDLTTSQKAFINPSNMPQLRHLSAPFSPELLEMLFGPIENQFTLINSIHLSGGPHQNFLQTKYNPCATVRSLNLRSGYDSTELCCLLALVPNLRKLKLVTYMATQGPHRIQNISNKQQLFSLTHLDLVVATNNNTIPNEHDHILWYLAPNVESVRLFMWLANDTLELVVLHRTMMRIWTRLHQFSYLFRIEKKNNETVDIDLLRTQLMPLFSQIKQRRWRIEPRIIELYTDSINFRV